MVFLTDCGVPGWNDVSWHNPLIHSPVLEQLAASGVLLDQYYVQPTCSPSRVAMMTGKYPYRSGLLSYHIIKYCHITVHCPLPTVHGPRFTIHDPRSMVHGPLFMI